MEAGYVAALSNVARTQRERNPDWDQVIDYLKRATRNGDLPTRYKHVLMQTSRPVDREGWVVFANIHEWIISGNILGAAIRLADSPKADADHAGNQAVLDSLPHPFRGRFWGGTDLSDGIIEWSEPIRVSQFFTEAGQEPRQRIIQPGSAQLEVGWTRPHTTFAHLVLGSSLARLPYGSRILFLLASASRTLGDELGGRPI